MASETTADTQHVVHVSSAIIGERCKRCANPIEGDGSFVALINHYITQHGYKLLHVGQQTEEGTDGPWQTTVAVLGQTAQVTEASLRFATARR